MTPITSIATPIAPIQTPAGAMVITPRSNGDWEMGFPCHGRRVGDWENYFPYDCWRSGVRENGFPNQHQACGDRDLSFPDDICSGGDWEKQFPCLGCLDSIREKEFPRQQNGGLVHQNPDFDSFWPGGSGCWRGGNRWHGDCGHPGYKHSSRVVVASNPWLTVFSRITKGLNMRRIKIGLKDVPLPKRIQAGRQVVESLTNNPHFPEAGPWRELLLAATNELEASYNDAQSSRQITTSKISFQHEKAKEFNRVMSFVAGNITTASDLDPTKVLSAGFDLCAANKAIGPLPAPTGLVVLPGDHAGAMELYWNSVRGVEVYNIEYTLDGAGELPGAIHCCTKVRTTLNALTSGQRYWFRVAALGAAGQSPWSQPVARFAP